jgi:hypothetical protein
MHGMGLVDHIQVRIVPGKCKYKVADEFPIVIGQRQGYDQIY